MRHPRPGTILRIYLVHDFGVCEYHDIRNLERLVRADVLPLEVSYATRVLDVNRHAGNAWPWGRAVEATVVVT